MATAPLLRLGTMSKENEIPFDFEVPVTFFEKADAAKGKQRRIGGIISTEQLDRQGEVVLQRGLDFNDFLNAGWYNDNHTRDTTGILGYPEVVQQFSKGDLLPSGEFAPTNVTWAEGYLLNTKRADDIWELGLALQGTGRHLGYSVEGGIQRRAGKDKKVIAKAKVRNVAITHCPVNDGSRLDILAKSLLAVEAAEPDPVEKALSMGTESGPTEQPAGPKTGEGAGQVLTEESLEDDERPAKKEETKKSLSDAEAVAWLQSQRPDLTAADAGRIVDITKRLKARGRL